MIIDTKKIEDLIYGEDYSIYEIAKDCGISSRTSLNNARNRKNIDNLTLETVKKIQKFIKTEEVKMKVMSKEDLRSVDMEYREQVIELVDFLENNTMDEEFELLANKLNELGFETEDLYPKYRGGVEIIGLTSLENVFREVDGEYEVLYANFKDGKCVGIYWGA